MKSRITFAALVVVLLGAMFAGDVLAGERQRRRRAAQYTWHGRYYHQEYGTPVALVVPPNAALQSHWQWGVPSASISRINHQFGRGWPGPSGGGQYGFAPTPLWPSHTNQFGVYYVRAPWR